MRRALWIDLREPGQKSQVLLFEAPAPIAKNEREARLQAAVTRIWPRAQLVSYSGGVAEFSLGAETAIAHFGPVRDEAELLPLEGVLPFREHHKRHPASFAESLTGDELQLSLL